MNRLWLKILLAVALSSGVHATEAYWTLLGFELEKTTLFDIQKKLGEAPIRHAGDAAASSYEVCYQSPEHRATLSFLSGEMGGPDHTLLGFAVRSTEKKRRDCGSLTADQTLLKLGVLELGKNIDAVRRSLPQPVRTLPDGLEYHHITKLPFTPEERERMHIENPGDAYWDVSVAIRVYEANGRITGYEVSKVTSW